MSQFFHCWSACVFRFVSFVFNCDPCERRRPRPRDLSTPPGSTTAPQRQEGQLALEMCRSGRFSAADLSACVSAGPTSEPTLRRLASAVAVGTRVRKGKREQHHKTHCQNTTSVWTKQCNAPASIPVWSEVENRQTYLRTFSILMHHEMLQHAAPEGAEQDRVAAAHLGVDTKQGHWACMSVWEGQRSLLCEGFRFRFSSHVAALDRLPSESSLDLCSEQAPSVRLWVLRKTHHGRRFPGFGVVFQGLLSGRHPRHDHKGEPFAPVAWQGGGTKHAHPRSVRRHDRLPGLAEASRRPRGVE